MTTGTFAEPSQIDLLGEMFRQCKGGLCDHSHPRSMGFQPRHRIRRGCLRAILASASVQLKPSALSLPLIISIAVGCARYTMTRLEVITMSDGK